MPTENEISLGNMFVCMPDGTYEPFGMGNINVIPDETISTGDCLIDKLNIDGEVTGTFTLSHNSIKRMMRALYGWQAKGPIRYRVIHQLWEGKYGRAR